MSTRAPPDPNDPIEYFISHKEKTLMQSTIWDFQTALGYLRDFLEEKDMEAGEMTEPDAIDFLAYLEEESSANAAESYSERVSQFYQFYSSRGTFETNPMSLALEDWEYDTEYREPLEVPLEDIREICQSETDPRRVLLFTILPKTGARVGELRAMNLSDIHLQHPIAEKHLPEPRREIQNEPDTLYIPPVLGGQKREVGTHVPIDNELKQALLYWLSSYIKPPEDDEYPLVQTRLGGGKGALGGRPSRNTLDRWVAVTAEKYGWWESGASYHENLTPHTFRHIFSTYAQHEDYGGEMDRDVVEYIRGDTGNVDTLDQYHHRWGKDTQKEYLSNIFKLYE